MSLNESSIDELIKKSTIEFEKPINLKEAKDLMKYLANELPALLTYTKEETKTLYGLDGAGEAEPKTTTISFSGTIATAVSYTHLTLPTKRIV